MGLGSMIKQCEFCQKPFTKETIKTPGGPFEVCVVNCDCKDKYDKSRLIKRLIIDSGIPAMYRVDDMQDWAKIPGIEKMVETVKLYLGELSQNLKMGKGMLIAGTVGTGKTRMLCYVLKKVISHTEESATFITSGEINSKLLEHKDGTDAQKDIVTGLMGANVLVIDDLGETNITDWRRAHFTAIINDRYYKSRPTFFNTMKTIKELEKNYGDHIMSRICQMCEGFMVEVESTIDMRKEINRKEYLDG